MEQSVNREKYNFTLTDIRFVYCYKYSRFTNKIYKNLFLLKYEKSLKENIQVPACVWIKKNRERGRS